MNPLRSLSAKISLLTSLLALGVIAWMSQGIFRQIQSGLVGEMRVRAEFFARSAREAVFPKLDPFALHFAVEELVKERAVTYAAVVDAEGRVLSHSEPRDIGEVLGDEVSRRAASAEAPLLQRFSSPGGGSAYEWSIPLRAGTRRVGAARLGFDESSIAEALRAQKRRLLTVAEAATAVAVLGTFLIVGWITRPLPRLAAAAREIGKGHFDARVDWRSRDEVGALARAFNDMATANKLLFTAIREEKEKLETVFRQTREGMVWTDPSGRILLSNPSARALLGCGDVVEGNLRDVLRDFSAFPPLDGILAGRARLTLVELRREKPKLLILSGVADRLGSEGDPAGLLFIFHDATIEKREETLARNFLSIVSHKLRTPLAVALGYLDVLLSQPEGLGEDRLKALRKIRTEDERLRLLVEKLMVFTLVQSPESVALEKVPTRLVDVVDEALKSCGDALAGVSVTWRPEEAASLPAISADARLLREAVANLIDNAVKFNRASSKEIRIRVAADVQEIRVSVRDNGPGVPSEEQPKLFRKFYQIDDDFTGQVPGFGLGLAFVKNVAEAHGGKAGSVSAPGEGSEFFFTVPRA